MNQCEIILDGGGERSATPLSPARKLLLVKKSSVRPKALSPLRSASAVQEMFSPSTIFFPAN